MLEVNKGQRASLAQNERNRLVARGQPAFPAGTLLKQNSDEEWVVAGASDAGSATSMGAELYIALIGNDNLTARYAGGQSGNTAAEDEQAMIPALPISEAREIITDMVDDVDSHAVNDLLTVGADGKFVAHTTGKTVYGRVSRAAYAFFDAHAVAVAGFRTGADVDVLHIETRFHPQVATA